MILVTGGTGFIGSHLLQKLTSSGTGVRALVRRRAVPRSLPVGVEAAYGDLRGGEGLAQALDQVETVIHLAGVTKALRADEYYEGNARASENLARAIGGRTIRLVHVSSLAAMGPCAGDEPVCEDTEPRPITHYGKSKLEAEKVVRQLVPEAVIVRPPVVYGPGDTDVFQLLKSISQGLVVEIAGGERWFSAIYVHDLVEGLLAAASSPKVAGRTYFLAHRKPATWSELARVAAGVMARTPRVLRVPVRLARAVGFGAEVWSRATRKPGIISREKVMEAECLRWVCDTRRAAAELDFEATTSLDVGLAQALAWYKEAGWLKY